MNALTITNNDSGETVWSPYTHSMCTPGPDMFPPARKGYDIRYNNFCIGYNIVRIDHEKCYDILQLIIHGFHFTGNKKRYAGAVV